MHRVRCYLAGPLFTPHEREYNAELARQLERVVDVYLPQRDGVLLSVVAEQGGDCQVARREVFDGDLAAIRAADCIVAILDGASVDDGVSFELGYAYALDKPCFGLAGDIRRSCGYFRNPMWEGAMRALAGEVEQLIQIVEVFARQR